MTRAVAPSPSPAAKPSPRPQGAHAVQGGTRASNRLAAFILEVLAGERSPTEAAAELGISLMRYYQLETRALEGLVAALEPRPKGKQPSPASRIAQLEAELNRAQRQCARQQALVRTTQRSLGIVPAAASKPAATKSAATTEGRPTRKRRRPTVRALKAARTLRERPGVEEPDSLADDKNARPADGSSLQPTEPASAAQEGHACPV